MACTGQNNNYPGFKQCKRPIDLAKTFITAKRSGLSDEGCSLPSKMLQAPRNTSQKIETLASSIAVIEPVDCNITRKTLGKMVSGVAFNNTGISKYARPHCGIFILPFGDLLLLKYSARQNLWTKIVSA